MDQCNDILAKQNIKLFNKNEQTRFLFSKIISKESYESATHDAGAIFASYEDWYEEANKDYDRTDFDYTREEIISALTIYTPDLAIDAWRDCMSSGKSRFNCSVYGDPKGLNFRLEFDWHPSDEIGGYTLQIENFDIRSDISSEDKIYVNKQWKLRPGKITLILTRPSINDTITGAVSGVAGVASFTSSFVIPAYKEPKKKERKVLYRAMVYRADNAVIIRDKATGVDFANTGNIDQDPTLNLEYDLPLKEYPVVNDLLIFGYNASSSKGDNPYHFVIDVVRLEKTFGTKIETTTVKNYRVQGIGGPGFWLNTTLSIQPPEGAIIAHNQSELDS